MAPIARRQMISGLGALAAGCIVADSDRSSPGGPSAAGRARVVWRLASSFPRSLDTIFGACEHFAARLAELTDGAFQIRVYPAGELVPALEVLDAVQSGTAQCGQTGSYYYIGKNPVLAFDTCVPFGLTAREQAAWLTEGGGLELLNRRFADFGVRAIPAGNTGVQMGGWFRQAPAGLADLQGLKMRIPGLGGRVMAALGVSVQNIAGGEIFPALERGAIDATEWVGPADDEKLGFHKAAPFYCTPGWWEPGPNLSYYVNLQAWEALPAHLRAAFEAAAAESARVMQARYDARNPEAFARLLAAGVQVRPFPDDVLRAARAASAQLLADEAARDPGYREVYEHWLAFRDRSAQWFRVAELGYQTVAFGG
jgi:TRAP-type mannitol/chloroaromatic compound transport system substrate-binding protein